MDTLLVATRNPGKQREIAAILEGLGPRIVFPNDIGLRERVEEERIETGETFEQNAVRKAEYFARLSRLPTCADDSGIEVFALGGRPGVRSRRFAMEVGRGMTQDEANNAELLRRLAGATDDRRRARYRCVVALLTRVDAVPRIFDGECSGRILQAPDGTNGFGYDPLFFSDDLGQGFGTAEPAAKDEVSHRGRAFRQLAAWMTGGGS